jgi:protein-S-isoprenylcysteine O-methyltransferase Ste14
MPRKGYSGGVFFDKVLQTCAVIGLVINMRNIRWSNVPIPQSHVIFLLLGMALHLWFPLKAFEFSLLQQVLGWLLLVLGGLVAAWAVLAIKDMDISNSTRIIDTGPYGYSRNPMYVAWTAMFLGTALLLNTWWLLIFLPALMAVTHYFVVRREERQLEQRFGEEYQQYCDRVRRYL